jgi:hypothetical protein
MLQVLAAINYRSSIAGIATRALILIPVLSLALALIAGLCNGIDLPHWDDWRAYTLQKAQSFDIQYLFMPVCFPGLILPMP